MFWIVIFCKYGIDYNYIGRFPVLKGGITTY